jgi:hypothetical protein
LIYSWWTTPLPESLTQRVNDVTAASATAVSGLTFQKVGHYIYDAIVMMLVLGLLGKVLTTLFGTFVSQHAMWLVRWKDTVRRIALGLIISTIGFVAAVLHVYIFDKRFLSLGTLQRVKQKNG